MTMHPGGTDALMREIFKMKGVYFEMDPLSLQIFAGGSTQISSSINYSWNLKQFNRRLVIGRRVLHSPS
ncbi:S-adenosylhomocysteine hydrolase (fragment) [Photobacterium kishitanii]